MSSEERIYGLRRADGFIAFDRETGTVTFQLERPDPRLALEVGVEVQRRYRGWVAAAYSDRRGALAGLFKDTPEVARQLAGGQVRDQSGAGAERARRQVAGNEIKRSQPTDDRDVDDVRDVMLSAAATYLSGQAFDRDTPDKGAPIITAEIAWIDDNDEIVIVARHPEESGTSDRRGRLAYAMGDALRREAGMERAGSKLVKRERTEGLDRERISTLRSLPARPGRKERIETRTTENAAVVNIYWEQVFDQLSSQQRKVFIAHVLEDRTFEDIAALGITPTASAARTHFGRARRTLRATVRAQEAEKKPPDV
jgi:hypothetical protein